jgi:hypothetical protein
MLSDFLLAASSSSPTLKMLQQDDVGSDVIEEPKGINVILGSSVAIRR